MAAPTSTIPDWATDAGTRTAPNATRQGSGWIENDKPPALLLNGVLGPYSDWLQFVSQHFPTDDELEIGRITGVGDPGGSGDDLYITSTSGDITVKAAAGAETYIEGSSGGDVYVRNDSGDESLYINSTSVNLLTNGGAINLTGVGASDYIGLSLTGGASGVPSLQLRASTGEMTATALVAAESTDTGKRYGYPAGDPLDVALSVSPTYGGFQLMCNNSAGAPEWDPSTSGVAGVAMVLTAGGATYGTRGRLNLTHLMGNAEVSATVWQAVELDSSWGATATTNTVLRLVERDRSTGTETVLLSVSAAGTSDDNSSTPQDLDPQANAYFVEFYDAALNSISAPASDIIEEATLTLRKFAVE